jgi:hypothetical protein
MDVEVFRPQVRLQSDSLQAVMTDLTEWPDEERMYDNVRQACEKGVELDTALSIGRLSYERARAEAAIARLKVAVKALKKLNHPDSVCKFYAAEALDAIGEIPSA